MSEPVKMTIGVAYAMHEIIDRLLKDKEGKERTVPFDVKYKLRRASAALEKDVYFFQEERNNLIKKYGEDDGQGNIKVTDENSKVFAEEVGKLLGIEVEHTFKKLHVDDIDAFSDFDVDLASSDMDLFMAVLVDDPELVADLQTPIKKDEEAEDKKDGE